MNLSNEFFSSALNNILTEIYRDLKALEERTLKKMVKLTRGEIYLLEAVDKGKDNGMSISEIANELNITCPSVSVAINKLEKKGYVKKRGYEKDGRSIRVYFTKEGAKINAYHKYYRRRMVRKISDDLTDEEKQFLLKTINKLKSFLDKKNNKEIK